MSLLSAAIRKQIRYFASVFLIFLKKMGLDKIKNAYIVDPYFGNRPGHWESFERKLHHGFSNKGKPPLIICQKKTDSSMVEGLNVLPWFDVEVFPKMPTREAFLDETEKFSQQLTPLQSKFSEKDFLLFPSISPHILKAIIDWKDAWVNAPKMAVLLQFPASQDKPAESINHPNGLDWIENEIIEHYASLKENLKKSEIPCFAICEELARNYSLLLDYPIRTLNLPVLPRDENNFKTNDKLRIGYFGRTSKEKGGTLLPEIVQEILKKHDVEFRLHLHPVASTEKALEVFKTNTHPNIDIKWGHLSMEALEAFIREMDIILLSYDPKKYRTTPSSVFAESIVFEKVAVISKNSWMESIAKQYSIPVVAFDSFAPESIIHALSESIKTFHSLKKELSPAKKRFCKEHNINRFIENIAQ